MRLWLDDGECSWRDGARLVGEEHLATCLATQPECPNYAGASLVVAAFGQEALRGLLTRLGAKLFEHVPSAAWCAD